MKYALTLLLSALALPGALVADSSAEPPPFTEDGLALVENSEWGLVYVEPGADLSGYERVMLLETYVAFKKNWRRDQNRSSGRIRVSENDMERIKERLAGEFSEVFTSVLEDAGYPVVDETAEDVLILRPAIINLDVVAPDIDRSSLSRTYAERAGEMTIYLEMHDGVTGDLIAKGMDRKADRRSGYLQWQSSLQNKQAARRILRGWAESIVQALDKAHGKG